MTFTVFAPTTGQHFDALLGDLRFDFAAGDVTARSEGDEIVLRLLVAMGLAAPADTPAKVRRSEKEAI